MICIEKNGRSGAATCAALGIFDGVHLGHRRVITEAVKQAQSRNAAPAVFTFNTSTVTTKGRLGSLLTDEDKLMHFGELGVEYVYDANFPDLRELSPEEFVKSILADRMQAVCAVCGENFHFGKGGTAGAAELKSLCAALGIEVIIVPPLMIGGGRVSSTRIRELLRSGGVSLANALLGYRYALRLEVAHGAHLARTWDFPTINQVIPAELVKLRFGVYCVKVHVGEKEYAGVCNVGVKPTVGLSTPPLAETFIIGFEGDLYGQVIKVEFCEFVRPEMKFADFDELRAEIARNTEFTKRYFGIKE